MGIRDITYNSREAFLSIKKRLDRLDSSDNISSIEISELSDAYDKALILGSFDFDKKISELRALKGCLRAVEDLKKGENDIANYAYACFYSVSDTLVNNDLATKQYYISEGIVNGMYKEMIKKGGIIKSTQPKTLRYNFNPNKPNN